MSVERTIRLTVEYDGTDFVGWQTQPNGLAVQQVIEEALFQLLGEPVRLYSSGRTDSGVHALGMAASFMTGRNLPLRAFVEGTNRFLPPAIAIRQASEVAADFNPIRAALYKHYRYTILNHTVRSPLNRLVSWHVRESLDLAAMQSAAMWFSRRPCSRRPSVLPDGTILPPFAGQTVRRRQRSGGWTLLRFGGMVIW